AGWHHRLACDSFAARGPAGATPSGATTHDQAGFGTEHDNSRFTKAADPFRFAVTAALVRRSGLPVILMVSHDLGGGIRRHINGLAERYVDRAHVFLLAGTERGVTLSLPAEPNLPVVTLNGDCLDDLVMLLRSAGVSRVHIHHLLYVDVDVRRLIHRLDVPFDVTVHDYYPICPQVNLLRWPEALYCGEPDIAGCNACIAAFSSHHAHDIVSWRHERDWQFIEADRVICPSEDVKARMARYGAAEKAFAVPHEPHKAGNWPVTLPDDTAPPLRIVLMGVLANHKGGRIVAAVAEAAEPGSLAIHLIGYAEASFPTPAAKLITATGQYQERDLADLLRKAKPHVLWFPSTAPETYSYALSTAIESGLPIVAANLGAFPERLAGRPNTWLVDTNATTQAWLKAFDDVRNRLRDRRAPPRIPRPASAANFYETGYLAPPPGRKAAAGRSKPRIAVLPERLEHGGLTPSAYIRLLQPLDHPSIADAFEMLLVDVDSVFDSSAEIVITHRDAIPDRATADRLAAHLRRASVRLVYDLDDNLLDRPADGHEATVVHRMVAAADAVWVATQGLAAC
ncbi:MAG TPA: glycosyltransferase, partial [Rhodopila sp.]